MKQTIRSGKARGGATAAVVVSAAFAIAAAPAARAQVPFQILKPENGATVKETVRLRFSRKALDDLNVKYLSISLDGKFREALAVLPARTDGKPVYANSIEVSQTNVNVLWNTKAANDNKANDKEGGETLGVPDGPHKLEIVPEDANGKRLAPPLVLTLNVNNTGGMQIPADGLPLVYRFQIGDKSLYREVASVEYVGDRQANTSGQSRFQGYNSQGFGGGGGRGGGPPGGFPGAPGGDEGGFGGPRGGGKSRFMPGGGGGFGGPGGGGFGAPGGGYNPGSNPSGPFHAPVQNVTANYERTTEDKLDNGAFFIRDKVMDGIIIGGNGSASRLEDVYDFKSRYRTVLNTGFVKDYGVANAARPGAYVALLLPNLGGGLHRIGTTWRVQTPIQLEWATLDKPPVVFATNTLEGLEWQNGYETARIKQTFNGKADIPIYGGAGKMRQANVQLERTIWFAPKPGKLIRMETDMTVDGPAPASILAAMVPAAGVGGAGGGDFAPPGGGPGGLAFPAGFPGGGDGPGGAGLGNGSLGGLQQQQEEQKAPAKFQSHTVVSLIIPGQTTATK